MFNKMKKMVAGLLAAVMITTNVCPMVSVSAASGVASLESLGKLGTVNIGSKSESGTWLQTQVDSKPVFCMDLGKACHTGYTYKSESKTISSDGANTKNKLEAKIGYWYDQVKKGSNKAWVYAQCLIWSVEEGYTSESNLKSVINQVKKNTGYYKDDTLYSDIFEIGKKWNAIFISGNIQVPRMIAKFKSCCKSNQPIRNMSIQLPMGKDITDKE